MSDVVRITDRIALIRLPLPLDGLTSVNCYALLGDDETILVDPGWSSPETERGLRSGLDELGLEPRAVARILTTHHHWDHYTQAITWQRRYGIPTHLGAGEHPSIEAWRSLDGAFPRQVGLLERAGAADLAREVAAIPVEPHERAMDFDLPAAWIGDGDEFDCGGLVVRALATPGHTRGHTCFEVLGEDLILTGDHVLPRITPSIAYEREPDQHSLTSYLGSLRLVADTGEARMLPAHGAHGASAVARSVELIAHHDERLSTILQLVAAGRPTAYDVARGMPWTRHERRLADLEIVHRMVAVLEVSAHLAVLRRDGLVHHHDESGTDVFRAA